MDPQETLKRWRKAVAEGDRSEAAEFAGYLRDWLARGGFEPTWHDAKERAKFISETREARDTRNQREIEAERDRLRKKPGGEYVEGVGWFPHGSPGLEAARARARSNPAGMGMIEALAWGLAAAGALYLIFKPSPASAAIVPASAAAARIPPATQPRAPVTDADRAAIVGVQDRLRAVGYQPGPSTGTWTHDTNYAIAFLQQDEGLPRTGILDSVTAQRLAAKYARVIAPRATPPVVAEEEGFWERLLTLYG